MGQLGSWMCHWKALLKKYLTWLFAVRLGKSSTKFVWDFHYLVPGDLEMCLIWRLVRSPVCAAFLSYFILRTSSFSFPHPHISYSEGLCDTFKSHPARGTWLWIRFPSCVASSTAGLYMHGTSVCSRNKNSSSISLVAIPCLVSQSSEAPVLLLPWLTVS